MGASLILHTKEVKGDEIIEIKIWKVPKTHGWPDGVKVSLVYTNKGERLVGYDNAERKGYHRHYHGDEKGFSFSDIWQLLRDFEKDVEKLRGGN